MGMSGMMSLRALAQDASIVKQKVKPGTAKRAIQFAAPYAGVLALFLFILILDAGLVTINPLIYREIIDKGILKGDVPLIVRLAILAGVLSLVSSGLGLTQAYLSTRIGASV